MRDSKRATDGVAAPAATASWLEHMRPQLQQALIAWYRRNRRPLPWRAQPSLYATVVSEFMLQQTQVKTALPYYLRWMEALPDFAALAQAPEARVLKLWEGLGYYARARRLKALAAALVERAEPPRCAQDWLELPGVGPYTAAAIASNVYGEAIASVDGNVVRVLCRLVGADQHFQSSAEAVQWVTPLAQRLVPERAPGDWNQAVMELGATVCRKRKPACLLCPWRDGCRARAAGDPEALPRLQRPKVEALRVERVWALHSAHLLLQRHAGDAQRLAEVWELPEWAALQAALASAGGAGGGWALGPLVLQRQRGISNQRLTERIHALELDTPGGHLPALPPGTWQWCPVDGLDALTLSGPHRRWINTLLAKTR